MGAAITLAGADLIAQKQVAKEGLDVVRFIFANVPGLNHSAAVDRAAGLPPAEQIVHTAIIPAENKGYVNPNQVVYSVQVGSDVGDWDFNWIGLETAEGVLFAVSYTPLQQKRRNIPPLQLGNNLTRNFLVVFDGAQALTGITIDASTWQHDFTVRLAGIDERERLSNRDVYGRACFFGSSLQLEKVGGAYQLKTGTAYVEGVRLDLDATLPVVPDAVPGSAWLDVTLERSLNDVVTNWQVVWGAGLADYADVNGVQHYLVRIADLPDVNTVTDLRPVEPIEDPLVQHFAIRNRVTSVTGNIALTERQRGLVLIDAATVDCTITLPKANAALGVADFTLRRKDLSARSVVITTADSDALMLDTSGSDAGQSSTELLFAGDWLQLRSDADGHWWCMGQAQLPGSIADGMVAFVAAGSHTFTVPPVLRSGRRRARVTVTGGGGGAGGGVTSPIAARGGGGGAGASAIGVINLVGVYSVETTVGAAGTGGGSGQNGAPGGSSSFGAYLSALGGGGGGGATSSNSPAGAHGGTASGGSLNLVGGSGSDGPVANGAGTGGSGDGGGSLWGGGARSASGVAIQPTAAGAGGGGTDGVGGSGAAGVVFIEW